MSQMTPPQVAVHPYPLDPLTLQEMQQACDVLRQEKQLDERCRFPIVELLEPAKGTVLSHVPGQPAKRSAGGKHGRTVPGNASIQAWAITFRPRRRQK